MTIQLTVVWLLLVSRTYRCRNFHINPSSRLELYLQAQSVGLGGHLLSIFYAQHWARCSRQQQQQQKKEFQDVSLLSVGLWSAYGEWDETLRDRKRGQGTVRGQMPYTISHTACLLRFLCSFRLPF